MASDKKKRFIGFWNDGDGLSIGDVIVWFTIPPWLYTAYKYALSTDLSANQVDFFTVLTYPLLVVIGGMAITGFNPLKRLRFNRDSSSTDNYTTNNLNGGIEYDNYDGGPRI